MRSELAILTMGLCGCVTASTVAPGAVVRPPPEDPRREPELLVAVHVVQPGETLYRIARAYDVTVDALMESNRIDDPRSLRSGERLTIPGAGTPRPAVPFDSPEPTARTLPPGPPPPRTPRVVSLARAKGSLEWPLRGVLYARFGVKGKELHDGIDLAAPAGTPVKTAGPGTVLFAGEQPGYGLIAIIQHQPGLLTLYAHNRDLRVKTGQEVRRGQVVATVGDSGKTSGPHLHFEVRKDGRPVDPLDYLGPVPRR